MPVYCPACGWSVWDVPKLGSSRLAKCWNSEAHKDARTLAFEVDEDEQAQLISARLDYLRGEIEAECISYGEIAELQDLAEHIPADDLLLRQWAGIEEEK